MKFTGMIKAKTDKAEFGEKNTPKLSTMVEEVNDNEYKTSITFDWIGDEKVAMVEDAKVGDVVTVFYNMRSNEHEGKYYNSINGWKIENMSQKSGPQSNDPTKADYTEDNFGE